MVFHGFHNFGVLMSSWSCEVYQNRSLYIILGLIMAKGLRKIKISFWVVEWYFSYCRLPQVLVMIKFDHNQIIIVNPSRIIINSGRKLSRNDFRPINFSDGIQNRQEELITFLSDDRGTFSRQIDLSPNTLFSYSSSIGSLC